MPPLAYLFLCLNGVCILYVELARIEMSGIAMGLRSMGHRAMLVILILGSPWTLLHARNSQLSVLLVAQSRRMGTGDQNLTLGIQRISLASCLSTLF